MWLECPDNCTSCSHGGVSYEAGDNGLMEVPDEATALLSHGFSITSPQPKASGKYLDVPQEELALDVLEDKAPAKGK